MNIYIKKTQINKLYRENKINERKCKTKAIASGGSRTPVDCLEGNHANRYTTDADSQ